MSIIALFCFLSLFFDVTLEATANIDDPASFSPCSCDLNSDTCDYLCCCDTECSSTLRSEWLSLDKCSNKKKFIGELYDYDECTESINRNLLDDVQNSLNYYTVTLRSLFCIYYNNTDEDDFFTIPTSFKTYSVSGIQSLLNEDSVISDAYNSVSEYNDYGGENYLIGDYLKIDSSSLSSYSDFEDRFMIPRQGLMGNCERSGVRFGINSEAECGFKLTECSVTAINNYDEIYEANIYTNKTMAKSISIDTSSIEFYSDSILDNTRTTAPPTIIEDSSTCKNVLTNVELEILYIKSTNIIDSANVKLKFSDIDVGSYVSRKFSVKFKSTSGAKFLSGNPGYIKGMPLRLGYREEDSADAITDMTDSFKLKGVNNLGVCLFDTEFTSSIDKFDSIDSSNYNNPGIKFGIDQVYSCSSSLSLAELEDVCSYRKITKNFLFHNLNNINFVGQFGNAQTTEEDDWIQIVNETIGDSGYDWGLNGENSCTFYGIKHLVFYYGKVGTKNNPQYYIINAKIYHSKTKWTFFGSNENTKQNFMSTVIISFIEIDQDYHFHYPDVPNILPRLPRNALYPFQYKYGDSYP